MRFLATSHTLSSLLTHIFSKCMMWGCVNALPQPQFFEGTRAQKRVSPLNASHMGREVKVILFLYCRKQRTQSPLEIVPVGALPNRRFEPELNVSSAFC